jgi:hypothetical protein
MKSHSYLWPLLPLLLMWLPSASAQTTTAVAPEPDGNDVEKITIIAKKGTRERWLMLRDFVTKLGAPTESGFGYARLNEATCFVVRNLPTQAMVYLVKRMSAAAQAAGLPKAKRGCHPNISLLFADNAKALADSMVKNEPRVFKPFGNEGGTTRGSQALKQFTASDAPIRWWQVTVPVDWSGQFILPNQDAADLSNGDGSAASIEDSLQKVQGMESRIIRSQRDKLLYTLVIVDMNKLGDATWDQLADYLAMVSLVQVKPDTNMAGYDTILNLFTSGAKAPPMLTSWDKAYLHGVYALNQYLMPFQQNGALTTQLLNNFDALESR